MCLNFVVCSQLVELLESGHLSSPHWIFETNLVDLMLQWVKFGEINWEIYHHLKMIIVFSSSHNVFYLRGGKSTHIDKACIPYLSLLKCHSNRVEFDKLCGWPLLRSGCKDSDGWLASVTTTHCKLDFHKHINDPIKHEYLNQTFSNRAYKHGLAPTRAANTCFLLSNLWPSSAFQHLHKRGTYWWPCPYVRCWLSAIDEDGSRCHGHQNKTRPNSTVE